MPNLNSVTLCGHLTRDVTLKYLPSGTAVAEIGLAVNNRVKKNDEWIDQAVFVDVTAFAHTAENASKWLSKGAAALITGRLVLDQWDDKQTGAKRSKLKVVADTVQGMGPKAGGTQGAQRQQRDEPDAEPAYAPSAGASGGIPDDDVPFGPL